MLEFITGGGCTSEVVMSVVFLSQDVREELRDRTVVVIGSSVQRSVYKDLVVLMQGDRYITEPELRKKGELTFMNDELLYGGVKGEKTNSKNYHECRSFNEPTINSYVDYFFVTRSYDGYIEDILNKLSDKRADVVIMSSCLWDVHRHYDSCQVYESNLQRVVDQVVAVLPHSLFIWLTAPPVDIRSKGGFKESKTDLVKVREVQMFNAIARQVFSQAAYNC